jgi:murein DD-endopeptidase MepM/ murein hydrolase activator NlpD
MIESQTKLPVQEGGPATFRAQGRQAVASLVAWIKGNIPASPGSGGTQFWRGVVPLISKVAKQSRFQPVLARVFRRARTGFRVGTLLDRFALHLVVLFLAAGVVAISQFSLPQIDLFLPTPTPAPDLGGRTITSSLTNRGSNRFVSSNAALFQVPVPHTVKAERESLEIITYTVQTNDNVYAIAQGFGLDPQTVLWANPAIEKSPDLLSVGQELVIPPVDGVYCTVQAGDTVEKLAKQYQTSVEKIISFEANELGEPPYILTPGRNLMLPDGRKRFVPSNYYPLTRVYRTQADALKGSGRFAWPTQGLLTQSYWSGHLAVDVGNRTGTPIYAADGGYVVLAGRDTWGYGNQVLIDHGNGYLTRYAHLDTILVKAGQSVKKNQQIGTMGNTGRSTGPHLHFEVYYNEVRRNPLGFLP